MGKSGRKETKRLENKRQERLVFTLQFRLWRLSILLFLACIVLGTWTIPQNGMNNVGWIFSGITMMAHEEITAKEWIEPLGKGCFIFCVTARLYEYACCFSIFKTKEFRILERLSGAGCLLGKPPKAIDTV